MLQQDAENILKDALYKVVRCNDEAWKEIWSAVMSLEEAVKADCAEDAQMRRLTEWERYQFTRIRQLAEEATNINNIYTTNDSAIIKTAGLIAEYAKQLEAPILNTSAHESKGRLTDTRTMDGKGKLTDTRKP